MLRQMETDAIKDAARAPPFGTRHWLFQFTPPLLMLGVFLMTTSGTALVFITGFLILPVLISLISIIAKLILFKTRKYYLVRPLLTIAIFVLIFVIAHWTYAVARDQAIAAAGKIHRQCNEIKTCPANPAGWQTGDSRSGKIDLGLWLKYPASYYPEKESFRIRLYQGPDLGDVISGGVDLPFTVDPYQER